LEDLEAQEAELLELERGEADHQLARGNWQEARKLLRQHLKDDPSDGASRALLAEVWLSQERFDSAVTDAMRAVGDLPKDSGYRARAARVCLRSWIERGRFAEAREALEAGGSLEGVLDGQASPQDALVLLELCRAQGDVAGARRWAQAGIVAPSAHWRGTLARGLCHRELGDLVKASREVVRAIELASAEASIGDGGQPDLLTALGELYFESEQEVEMGGKRSAGSLFKDALL
ncbi:MAG: tetratricopeptide repeat protein, partial [Planctomycetes bacterium]|nr:tetratricopeptide repeat protein [Planctomycetota bacterium]